MSYMQKMIKAMERLANLKATPAAICDWAEQRYAELVDRTATVSVPDLKHMSEYTDAIEAEDSDGFRQSLDNISGYLRRREIEQRGEVRR